MRIAIPGGTGTVGTHVAAAAHRCGHESVVLSRATGVNLMTGSGLAERLTGVDVVVDVSSIGSLSAHAATSFFTAVTANLLAAEREAGVSHHVVLSIVGAAAAPSGYYAGKAAQESRVMASDVPWSILRTTQFHEFAAQTAARKPVLGVVLVPAMRSQPVAAAEVADALVRIAESGPVGIAPDLAGPERLWMSDMVCRYLAAVGRPARVLTLPMLGPMGRAMRDGGLLPGPAARLSTQTYEQWLAALTNERSQN